ncbi:MAG: hypothetical protein HY438_00800 [DPANN group archaeon]|nr:hypothetical protein [DPANN group archaeon]
MQSTSKNTTTIRISKDTKHALDKMFDPKKHTYSGAIEQLMSVHRTKWNFMELYIASVVTLILILLVVVF